MKNLKFGKMSLILAICIILGLLISFIICLFIQQLFFEGSRNLTYLLKHDFWHILIFGAIMFLVLWVLFRIMILRPIYNIYKRLNALTFKKSEGSYCIEGEDLQTVLESINRLIYFHEKNLECASMQKTHKIIEM